MQVYRLDEALFYNEGAATSAADAVQVLSTAVPRGKVWTILDITYFPSVTETRVVAPYVMSRGNVQHVIDYAASRAINPAAVQAGLLPAGIEIVLFAGERIGVWRDVATAGSTMTMNFRYIETDMPGITYIDPQIQRARQRAGENPLQVGFNRSSMAGAEGRGVVVARSIPTKPSPV